METLLRSTIMLGTLIVGGMALYLYGPPPEEAASMLEGALERGWVLIAEFSTDAAGPSPEAAPNPVAPGIGPALEAPSFASPSPQLAAPATLAPLPSVVTGIPSGSQSLDLASDPQLAPLAAELQRLGATDLDLRPWGAQGEVYLFRCSAPVTGAGGFERRFQIIDSSPQAAIAEVLRLIRGAPQPGLVSAAR